MNRMNIKIISVTMMIMVIFSVSGAAYADYGFSPSTKSDYGFNGTTKSDYGFIEASNPSSDTNALPCAVMSTAPYYNSYYDYRYWPGYVNCTPFNAPCFVGAPYYGNAGPCSNYCHNHCNRNNNGQWRGCPPPPPAYCHQCRTTHHYGHFHYNAAKR